MTDKWKNDHVEAWTLEDGSLVIKTKVPLQNGYEIEGHDHYFTIDTLEPADIK